MPKRKAVDLESLPSKKAKPATTSVPPETSKKRKVTHKGKSKKNAEDEETPPGPRVKRINKVLKAKVKQISDFIDTTGREESRLKRSPDNENHVIVTQTCLLSSLMAMHADWDLTDPRMASLLEASEAIVDEYEQKWATRTEMMKMIVLDLGKETAIVEGIQQKIEGHGLEGINLLEVELELYTKQAENEAALRLFSAFEETDQGNDSDSVDTSYKGDSTESSPESSATSDEDDWVAQGIVSLEEEKGRQGVCPAPMQEP